MVDLESEQGYKTSTTYGIFETFGVCKKSRSFNGAEFSSIEEAIGFLGDLIIDYEIDDDNDAADVFSKHHQIFTIERI